MQSKIPTAAINLAHHRFDAVPQGPFLDWFHQVPAGRSSSPQAQFGIRIGGDEDDRIDPKRVILSAASIPSMKLFRLSP
jgi:hypothetical protein